MAEGVKDAGGNPAPDLVVTGIGQLATLHPADGGGDHGPRRGAALDRAHLIAGAALLCGGGRVLAAGEQSAVLARWFPDGRVPPGIARVDAGGKAVVPGFVDPHTHLVFGRMRYDEYERRIRGETYLQIAAAGGGIHSSVADVRSLSEDQLTEKAVERMRQMLAHGTTTAEVKSGYGLTLQDELKMLRAAGRAAALTGLRIVRTCLAAHELPREYRGRREQYVDLVVREILPRVAQEGLAERCDVFCEPSVFALAETRRILEAAHDLGLRTTVHADELEPLGGAQLAAAVGAQSADHLLRIDEEGVRALARSATVAVLLPGTVFSLGLRDYAPARRMIEAGVAVALASDFNPGSCPILCLPLIMSIACSQMRLTPAEALAAATINAAWALGLQGEVGSLAPGKAADFVILDGEDHRLLPYRAGHNPVAKTYRCGREILCGPDAG